MTDIPTIVRRAIALISQRDADLITDDMLLRDELDLDSLDLAELAIDLSVDLGVELPEDAEECTSVGQLINLCEREAGRVAA